MGVLRWLFGRSKLNRADLIAIPVIIVSGLPIWAQIAVFLGWAVVSLMVEARLFGRDYHRLSDAYQRIAEDAGK
jgi:membrane protein implicated in regulation of membrane protease activity